MTASSDHPSPQNPRAFERALARIVEVERAEIASMLWSFAYFFSVLCAYYILRPLRDEMGVTVGQDGLKWLFVIVFLVMLAAVPVFGWVVSRFPRRRIVPVMYGFFIANLAMFWVAFQAGIHGTVGGRHVFRLGQRVQPVRGVAVLEPDVGPVAPRPGQAAVWLHRRGRQRRRVYRTADHAGPGAAGRTEQPVDRFRAAAGGVDRGGA